MNKKTILLLLIALFAVNTFAGEPPNVVIFYIDDLRAELGCYGSDVVKSPNIDALAKDGLMFNNAYCQQAICGPSRISTLTGMRPESVGIYSIFTPIRSVNKEIVTMPQFFKSNGYNTVSIGKVYHHATDDKESWSIHIPKETNAWIKPENLALIDSLEKAGSKKIGPPYECIDVEDEAYMDGRTAKNAIETLQKLKDEKFVMFVGLAKPHLPFNVPKKYWDLYNKKELVIPAQEAPKGMYANALSKWGELRRYYGMPDDGYLDDETSRTLKQGYYASISYTDAQIGKVMKALEDMDLRKNTMVVLISDHGWKLGEYGAWCKHTNFEIDVHVPMIVSRETNCKTRVSNTQTDALVENVDLFPTMAEICGLKIHAVEGQSILPVLNNPKIEWEKGAFSLYPRGEKIMGCTGTDGEWRYTEWRNRETQENEAVELYQYKKNNEIAKENYAGNPKYKEVEARMKKLLETQFPRNPEVFKTVTKPEKKKH